MAPRKQKSTKQPKWDSVLPERNGSAYRATPGADRAVLVGPALFVGCLVCIFLALLFA